VLLVMKLPAERSDSSMEGRVAREVVKGIEASDEASLMMLQSPVNAAEEAVREARTRFGGGGRASASASGRDGRRCSCRCSSPAQALREREVSR